jgi:universal stress protein E
MHAIENILLSIPPVPNSLAQQRAEQLALKLGAGLYLQVCDAYLDQSEFLQQQLKALRLRGIRAAGGQAEVPAEHASSAILELCGGLQSDLLIKQHRPDAWLQKLLVPDDWRLARESPVPLLLVRGLRPWAGASMLAAMDVEHQDAAHLALQGNVMDYASELCQLFRSNLHVVSAYSPVALQTAMAAELAAAVTLHCHDQCQWFQNEYELSERQLHLGEGPAKRLIADVARQLEVALVVLGTVARHGVAGALIGNTVEAVLDKLECDVLVLKPHIADLGRAERSASLAA